MTLLYDKTFPPRPATAKIGLKNAFGNNNEGNDTMRQFNYYGNVGENELDEEDVEKLEKEIDEVLKK